MDGKKSCDTAQHASPSCYVLGRGQDYGYLMRQAYVVTLGLQAIDYDQYQKKKKKKTILLTGFKLS